MGDILVDTRLVALVEQGAAGQRLAGELGMIQAENYQRRGHILAYNDEYTWVRIKKHAGSAERLPISVRCLGCGTVARMREWYVASYLTPEQADDLYWRLAFTSEPHRLGWLKACTSVSQARMFLDTWVEGRTIGQIWLGSDAQA